MGKNKLKKFSEMERIDFVLQYPYAVLAREGFPLRGNWRGEFFGNSSPVTLELGCGKGEYTVGLARHTPGRNFIGIDIKGARMWTGAKTALAEGLGNVAFLRTDIELLDRFFAPGEVDDIWITFPDPQMKKARKRLTGTRFLELYRKVLAPGGVINRKTDSPLLYTYTRALIDANSLELLADTTDLYGSPLPERLDPEVAAIRTYYESQWLERGLTTKYLSFTLPADPAVRLVEPEVEIEHDTYRSFSRGELQHDLLRAAATKPKDLI